MVIRIGLVILATLFSVGGAGRYWLVSSTLPKPGSGAKVPELSATVKIEQDGFGVPTIIGASIEDIYRGQGWITARDRLFQMDLVRRRSSGRLSEIFGKKAHDFDHFHRRLAFSNVASSAKRLDGKTIFGHKAWWKVFDGATADIWQIGSDILIPTSFMIPVSDEHFGSYSVESASGWGEKLNYVTARIKNKRGQVIGYMADGFGRISKSRAIKLNKSGELDNVVIAESEKGTLFLRTKKNMTTMDNLSA